MWKIAFLVRVLAALMAGTTASYAQSNFLFSPLDPPALQETGASSTTVLFSADEATLKSVDPLEIRMIAASGYFDEDSWANKSIREIFADATEYLDDADRTILRVVRAYEGGNPYCAAIWFDYVEKTK